MYKFLKYSDVLIDGVDLWEKCSVRDYMLTVGYSLTSVTGAIQLGVSFAYRIWP